MKRSNLESLLATTWRAHRRVKTVSCACQATTALIVMLCMAIMLDVATRLGDAGLAILHAALVAAMLLAGVAVIRACESVRLERQHLAAWIERRAGVADNALITAVQLRDSGRSDGLADMAIARGEHMAAHIDASALVDARPMRRAAIVLTATALGVIVVTLLTPRAGDMLSAALPRLAMPWSGRPPYTTLRFAITVAPSPVARRGPATITAVITNPDGAAPGAADLVWSGGRDQRLGMTPDPARPGVFRLAVERATPGAFVIDTPRGRSASHQVSVVDAPLITDGSVRVTPPTYAILPTTTTTASLDTRDPMAALVGSRATITIDASEPVVGGTATLNTDDGATAAMPMTVDPSSPHRAGVDVTVQRDAQITLVVRGTDGHQSPPRSLALRAVLDRAPRVAIESPGDGVSVPAGWPIDVTLNADDDLGLTSASLHPRINAATQPSPPLAIHRASAGQWQGQATVATDVARLAAGDTVELQASATDRRTPKPNVGESPTVRVRIISAEEYARQMRARYTRDAALAEVRRLRGELERMAAQRERLGRQLQAMTDGAGERAATREEAMEDAAKLAERSGEAARWMHRRAAGPRVFEYEAAYGEALEAEARRLDEWANAARDLLADTGDDAAHASARGAAAQRLAAMTAAMGGSSTWLDATQDAIESSAELPAQEGGSGDGPGQTSGGAERSTMQGPHTMDPLRRDDGSAAAAMTPRAASSGSSTGRGDAASGTMTTAPSTPAPGGVERVSVASTQRGGLMEPVLTGVPRRFADQAAAYFRRIADDAR